jgi:protoporphyrinogen oxidase
MKFGDYFDKVSAAWVWHRVHRVSRSRKGLLGAQVMGHFRVGTETLLKPLREAIAKQGGKIFCNSPVQAVKAFSGRVKSVVVSGTERDYESVVLSAPLPISAQMLPAELADYRAGLERVSFIGVACIAAWLDQPVTDAFWCNINDSRIPFNGIIEMSRLNLETGRGGALVYVPHYVRTNSPRFSLPDDKLIEEFAQALALLKPGMGRKSIKSFRVFRSRFAQPIFSVGFRKIQPRHETPLKGMFLIDATQLYPVDRTISGTITVAQETSRLVLKDLASGH